MKRNRFDLTAVRAAVGLCLALAAGSNTPAADLPKGLVLFLNFNEVDNGGVIIDRSGQKNNARASGVKWTTGKRGSAYEFGPANSYIQVANSMPLNVRQATFAAWFKTSKADETWRRILDKRTYSLSIGGGAKDAQGKLAAGINGRFWCLSDSSVADDTWHHAAATFDGASLKLYVDGQPQKQVIPCRAEIAPNASPLIIGQPFEGMIDEVMIFNRALTADEVKGLTGSGTGGTAAKGKDGKGKTVTKAQVAQQLNRLKSLRDAGLITQEFYEKKVEESKATVTE